MAQRDYYQILGIERNASERDIKQAYRRLARQYHPDVNPGDASAERKFKEISQAYSVLGHPEQRKKYDRFGHHDFAAGGGPSTAGRGFGGFQTGNLKDFFAARGMGGEGFGGLFEDLFQGMRQRPQPGSMQGKDLEQAVEIGFEEAIRGTTARIAVSRQHGQSERLQVKIPPGVDTGSKVRLAGKGEPGVVGGAAGDLYIVIRLRPHAYFTRQGRDILCAVPVTLSEALLGAKIDVPTIDGPTAMTLPAGTQNGQRFRLRGKGVPDRQSEKRGDQYVTVHVVLPEKLDARSRQLLEEFMDRNPLQPRAHMR